MPWKAEIFASFSFFFFFFTGNFRFCGRIKKTQFYQSEKMAIIITFHTYGPFLVQSSCHWKLSSKLIGYTFALHSLFLVSCLFTHYLSLETLSSIFIFIHDFVCDVVTIQSPRLLFLFCLFICIKQWYWLSVIQNKVYQFGCNK